MARKEIFRVEVGRELEIALVQCNDGTRGLGELDYYDVELARYNEVIVNMSTSCIGRKSGEFWAQSAINQMQRITFMADSIDMAIHNLMCYSANLLMDTPKPNYSDEWHRENNKVNMLKHWMRDITEYWGTDDKRTVAVQNIFNEYIPA